MSIGIIQILLGVIIGLFFAYQMWRMPNSNRIYVAIAVIAFILMILGYVIKHQSESFKTLGFFIIIFGYIVLITACYKEYRYEKSKKGREKAKRQLEQQEKEKKRKLRK